MKSYILVNRSEWGHNWTLVCSTPKNTRSFYLGQDVKFCHRVLGMAPSHVAAIIGSREIDNGTVGNIRLAKFICKQLGINGRNMMKIESLELCAE